MLLTSPAKTRLVVGGLEGDAQRLVLPLSPLAALPRYLGNCAAGRHGLESCDRYLVRVQ